MATTAGTAAARPADRLSGDDIREIAIEAYIYAYPLVFMELTRRTRVNVSGPSPDGRAPMNQFAHMPAFPDATFKDVVRPNADTLYSMLWFDVSNEPLILGIPDSGGRYYVLQMMDMWTDVFAAPGSRTTGTAAQRYVLVGPGWHGAAPAGTDVIRSPTASGWILVRAQTNGKADYSAVHKFQDGYSSSPLSQSRTPHTPLQNPLDPRWDTTTPPVDQIARLGAEEFFTLFAQLTRLNAPHANDYPILHRMRRIGLEPGKMFSISEVSDAVGKALEDAGPEAFERMVTDFGKIGTPMNGWRVNLRGVGTWGTDYVMRAAGAYHGLGGSTPEDVVYPVGLTDADGEPFSSDRRYHLHFDKDQLPPVRAFWSLTLYNERMLFAANKLDRYAIGDRDKLQFTGDGSLDLYIQRDSPGKDKESNWLPAPAGGAFTLALRLYWPERAVLDGAWAPPQVKRVS